MFITIIPKNWYGIGAKPTVPVELSALNQFQEGVCICVKACIYP